MDSAKNTDDRQTVPLTSDLVFKYVFGGEHSTRYLRSLLSAIQEDAGYPAVASVRIANPFNPKDADDGKFSVVDVRATDVNGTTFTIEAQSANHRAFGSRALYYWAKTYGGQLREGDFYTKLNSVVGINLLDFRLFPEASGAPLHTTFVPSCVQKPALPPLPDMVLHFLELPQYTQHKAKTSTALERWLYFIINRGRPDAMEDPVMKQILEESPEIAEAGRRYQEFIADEQLRSRLDARDKFVRTQAQLMHDAEQKGLEQGLEKGLEQGLEQGIEKGRDEERRETARRLKAKDMSIAEIAAVTDLPEGEIQEL
ncbi:MAG: Rpn family recombination-promoting nuclease/putative transposase [Spirochaeta sp.]|jgi:predicted transposase/invertase (TIGR01784 family)|nr:Rpn family recombination-promoting nuclease/putative transposase [Spirochaeta sp.]